ncbi:MAG TPA: bifunctional [glutamate--ammonia ligase]-adenylyl-L-tyrosine phosphorylase/[glutamate--ammonia-ligase] adenylyltransferase [Nitrospiraceae bacterium]|nr:bifunctional [glutamate--ammonia ligase]-adenylyl-L-tyrosine phosphorylase/[glutamate--ammonia-ligase] adenylyltransferase [Nitrospiraceae bacterium]
MSIGNHRIVTPPQLTHAGIQDAEQALKNLDLLQSAFGRDQFGEFLPPFLHALAGTADPDMALNNAERFVSGLEDKAAFLSLCRTNANLVTSLMTIFGASRFLSTYSASAAPVVLEALHNPDYLTGPADKNHFSGRLAMLKAPVEQDADFYRVLRTFRKQEMLRIGLRDLLGKADLQETVQELSGLAEACLQAAYEWVDGNLRKKHGTPRSTGPDGSPAGFAVIAMGKLGGRELNFSSDIDLMYVYSADGETGGISSSSGSMSGIITNHQYFTKLAEKLTSAIGGKTEDGFVFRVDLRLRPEGQRGPLAQSLNGYEIYYESWGQTWERSALLKARPVAGVESVGKEFMERIGPFVYRKYLDYGAIAEIKEMKKRINAAVHQKGAMFRDVKLGYGGIREIEFVIQALQLMHAGRDRGLRVNNALKALHVLSQKGLISHQEHELLSKAYIFLRTVEHRIQILDDLQTQTLPTDELGLRTLARRSGSVERGKETGSFLRDYHEHTRAVRNIYDDLFAFTEEEPVAERGGRSYAFLLDPETSEHDAMNALRQHGFRDSARAYRNLMLLREGTAFVHQTPRSRKAFGEMFPALFEELVASPDPDMALNHLESYLAAQDSWDALQSIIEQDRLVVKIMIGIFSNSDYFSRMLVSAPALLEDLLDASRSAGVGTKADFFSGLTAAMETGDVLSEKLDALRHVKHREEIRIGMADLLSRFPTPVVSRMLSKLAEACLTASLDLAAAETARRYNRADSWTGLAVVGVGKLGGREITYASDLDILFVYAEDRSGTPPEGLTVFEYSSKIAEKTIAYLTTMTREGFAYRVDTRLRPTGSKGPLVQSIAAFRDYYSSLAETWERQALVNARFVAGDADVGREFIASLEDLVYQDAAPAALARDVRDMRMKMEHEIGKEDAAHFNIKQGTGGLVDIEFIVQYLQLLHGKSHCRVRIPGTYNALRALQKNKLIAPDDYRTLEQAYLFFRLLESRMRIVTNQATNDLTRDPDHLRPLARRMGYEDDAVSAGQKMLNSYEEVSQEVRGMFDRIVPESGKKSD